MEMLNLRSRSDEGVEGYANAVGHTFVEVLPSCSSVERVTPGSVDTETPPPRLHAFRPSIRSREWDEVLLMVMRRRMRRTVLLTLLLLLISLCLLGTLSGSIQEILGQTSDRLTPRVKRGQTGDRPWYMSGGKDGFSSRRPKLFPRENPQSDRIEEQLLYAPLAESTKTILYYYGLGAWPGIRSGTSAFSDCPVKHCTLTTNKTEAISADAILFQDHFSWPGVARPLRQVWILYMLESPYHTQYMRHRDVFNWTATYRLDSDIVAPYEKWAYFDVDVTSLPLSRNYAANKTKQVAWFVSNCGARNSRLQYAHELQKYISVDIFGACGSKICPRSMQNKCYEMLNNDYKFYLAFENSNCKDYITEKFFVTGLGRDVIPIAMGARPEDYARSAPRRSYIHVDDFSSPKELAEYLHKLDKDDDLYNSYFRWKGTGEFINTNFFCRLCTLLHDPGLPAKSYQDINQWWRGPGVCTRSSWRAKGAPNWYSAPGQRLAANLP